MLLMRNISDQQKQTLFIDKQVIKYFTFMVNRFSITVKSLRTSLKNVNDKLFQQQRSSLCRPYFLNKSAI